jgi:hypothetical protein
MDVIILILAGMVVFGAIAGGVLIYLEKKGHPSR